MRCDGGERDAGSSSNKVVSSRVGVKYVAAVGSSGGGK